MEVLLITCIVVAGLSALIAAPIAIVAYATRSTYSLLTGAKALAIISASGFGFAGLVELLDSNFPLAWILTTAFVALALKVHRFRAERVQSALEHIASNLDSPSTSGRGVRGNREDAEITMEYRIEVTQNTKGGDSATLYTTIEATGPKVPLVLELRRQGLMGSILAKAGLAVDIEIGDPSFDRKYIIEGAPEAIVKKVLDQHVLESILRQRPRIIHLESGRLGFEFRGWRITRLQIDDMLAIATQLVGRAHGIFEAAEAALTIKGDSPYREAIDATAANQARREREKELRNLRSIRARRVRFFTRVGWTVAILVSVGMFIVWLMD